MKWLEGPHAECDAAHHQALSISCRSVLERFAWRGCGLKGLFLVGLVTFFGASGHEGLYVAVLSALSCFVVLCLA